jgi:CRP/FNR family transcriptional regulator, dissimilatory nitrate respiration regulator
MTDSAIQQKVGDFFAHYRRKEYTKHQILVLAGDNPPGIFYLREGLVGQYDVSPTGEKTVVNVFKPGAFFPMSWALNGTANEYFYEAFTDIKVVLAPAPDTVAFLERNPDVTLDLLKRVYRGADGLLRRTAHLMGGTARSRVLYELLNSTRRFTPHRPEKECILPFSEQDLATRTGLVRETVNRELRKLKDSGIIRVERNRIIVASQEALEQVVELNS